MRPHISNSLRQLVIERAQNRCEYCKLAQQGQAATFHIDHIIPISAGGQTTTDNLALACVRCSLHKAARQTVPDPETGETLPYSILANRRGKIICSGTACRLLALPKPEEQQ